MMLRLISLIFCSCGIVFAGEVNTQGGQIELGLVSEVRSIQPGETFSVALNITHAPKWHTYWKHPGIVGVPTSLDWILPDGFEAGEIQWPTPELVPMASLTAYGYEREVFLIVDIKPPADLKRGENVTLRAKGAWMACARTCHPGFGEFSITLPVAKSAAAEPDYDGKLRKKFDAERAAFPEDLKGWKADVANVADDQLTLTLRPTGNVGKAIRKIRNVYFYSYDNQVDSDAKQKVAINQDGAIEFRLIRPEFAPEDPSELAGLVYHPNGWPTNGGAKFARIRAAWSD
ncbi:MAG: protein-disulfide reductase DsbD domain-containing protein [Verrucomicrobiota bacterium]